MLPVTLLLSGVACLIGCGAIGLQGLTQEAAPKQELAKPRPGALDPLPGLSSVVRVSCQVSPSRPSVPLSTKRAPRAPVSSAPFRKTSRGKAPAPREHTRSPGAVVRAYLLETFRVAERLGYAPSIMAKNLTLEVLKQIRDQVMETNRRLDSLERRQGETEIRLATELVAVAGAVRSLERRQGETEIRLATELVAVAGVVRELRDTLVEDRNLRKTVEAHEKRIAALEEHAV